MSSKRETRVRTAALTCIGAVLGLACSDASFNEPPFEVVVTFPGSISVEPGAPVQYQGIGVGEVEEVTLYQASPREPARVALRLRVHDESVVLRSADRFEVLGGVVSDATVRITPAEAVSDPLLSGAVVEGVPPAVTRMRESVSDALESLINAGSKIGEDVSSELARSLGIEYDRPPPSREDFEDLLEPDEEDPSGVQPEPDDFVQ